MKTPSRLIFDAGLLALLVGLPLACGRPSQDAHDHGVAEHDHGAGEQGGDADTSDGGPPRLDLAEVHGVAFAEVGAPRQEGAWFAAEAVADEGSVVALTARVGGVVASFHAAPGQAVGRGQALLSIESPELADLKAAWLASRARALRAAADLERERRLDAAGATSRRELEAADAEAAVARAEEEATRLALSARGFEPEAAETRFAVRAPAAGVVSSLAVSLGQGVEAGTELGRLMAGRAALARVELPLPGPEAWTPGAPTEVRRADGRRWPARVEGVPAALSPETRRLAYRLRLAGEDLPLPGTPLEVRVPLATAIVLPQTALQQIEGNWGVFVRQGEEAVFRPVRRGAELGSDALVLEGLTPGETVATEGAYLLKALHLKLAGGGENHEH
jgi:cobalt-zinc-cadmium efflux system membrane fusion protein